jgi:hypothetical protein
VSAQEMSGLFVETVTERMGIHVLASTVRPATARDVEEAKALHEAGACHHSVVRDMACWPYDVRTCATCGQGLGLV